jgi:hypothetical protein
LPQNPPRIKFQDERRLRNVLGFENRLFILRQGTEDEPDRRRAQRKRVQPLELTAEDQGATEAMGKRTHPIGLLPDGDDPNDPETEDLETFRTVPYRDLRTSGFLLPAAHDRKKRTGRSGARQALDI